MIKKSIITLLFIQNISAFAAFKYIPGTIERVIDGDTVWVTKTQLTPEGLLNLAFGTLADNPNRLKIRMLSIDAPETHFPTETHGVVGQNPWGEESGRHLGTLLKVGAAVQVENHGVDKYGRVLGRVFKGNLDINLKMVEDGMAIVFPLCAANECDKNFLSTEKAIAYSQKCKQAQSQGNGIFDSSDPLSEMPYDFRARMTDRKPSRFIGNLVTKKYYAPASTVKVGVCDRIFFDRESDAVNTGFQKAQ